MKAMTDKIFIDREAQTGDFVMRMPEAAVPALYEMLQAAPLIASRHFHQAKQHLEDALVGEVNTLNAIMKYQGYIRQQDVMIPTSPSSSPY